MTIERFFQPANKTGWLWRFFHDFLDQMYLVQQGVSIEVDEVLMGRPNH